MPERSKVMDGVSIRQSLDSEGCNTVLTFFYWLDRVSKKETVDMDKFLRSYLVYTNGRRKVSSHQKIWESRIADILQMRKEHTPWKVIGDKYNCSAVAASKGLARFRGRG